MTSLLNPARIMRALDNATDALGMEHRPATRRAIFRAIDNPGRDAWAIARRIVVNDELETLGHVIFRRTPATGAGRDALIGGQPPTGYQILDALEHVDAYATSPATNAGATSTNTNANTNANASTAGTNATNTDSTDEGTTDA